MDLRYEVLGLPAQVLGLGQRPEIRRAGGADRPAHLHLARVVGSLGQRPRAEHRVEVAQVGGGGHRGLLGIEPLVDPLVHAQSVPARGLGHELPHALGAHARDRPRVVSALDHRGVGELFGHPPALEHVADHREVATGATDPQGDDVAAVTGEAIEEELHLGVQRDGIRGLRSLGKDLGATGFGNRFGPRIDAGRLRLARGLLLGDGTDSVERLFTE